MKLLLAALLASVPAAALARKDCGYSQYFSYNKNKCMKKKDLGQYCNTVQKCARKAKCEGVCVEGPQYPDVPYSTTKDSSSWATYDFEGNSFKSDCVNYGTVFGDPYNYPGPSGIDKCTSIEVNTPNFNVNWDIQLPAIIMPDNTVKYMSWNGPGSFHWTILRNFEQSPAYADQGIHARLFEQEVIVYYYEIDPETGLLINPDQVVPDGIFSYVRVVSAEEFFISKSEPSVFVPEGTCFTDIVSFQECPWLLRMHPGATKLTWAHGNFIHDYPEGTLFRVVEEFDFGDISDTIWERARMNGKLVSTFEEDIFHTITSFTVPMYLTSEGNYETGNGDFSLDYQETTYSYFNQTSTKSDLHVEGRIVGRKLYVASYMPAAAATTYNFHTHMNPRVIPALDYNAVANATNIDITTRDATVNGWDELGIHSARFNNHP